MQLDWHDLQTNGCPALLRALKLIETTLTQQEADITELQYLWSEEIMADLAPAPARPEVVEELGAGWQIVRQPNVTPGTITVAGTPADSWLNGDPLSQYFAAVDGDSA